MGIVDFRFIDLLQKSRLVQEMNGAPLQLLGTILVEELRRHSMTTALLPKTSRENEVTLSR